MSSISPEQSTPNRSLFPDDKDGANKKRKTRPPTAAAEDSDVITPPSPKKEEEEDGIVVEENGEDVYYEVEKIMGKKKINGKQHYLVKWKQCPESESTWEPIENLSDLAYEEAKAFDQANKKKKSVKTNAGKKKSTKKQKIASKKEEEGKAKSDGTDKKKEGKTVVSNGAGAKKTEEAAIGGEKEDTGKKGMVNMNEEVKEIVEEIIEANVEKETIETKVVVVEKTATVKETVEEDGVLDESTEAENKQGVLGKVGSAMKHLISPKKTGVDANE